MKVSDLEKLNEDEINEVVILSKLINVEDEHIKDLKPFYQLKYGQVLEMKAKVLGTGVDDALVRMALSFSVDNEGSLSEKEKIKKKKRIEKLDFNDYSLKVFFSKVNFIEKEFDKYVKNQELLNSSVDNDLLTAGVDELNVFGDLNVIDALASGDILKWESVLDLEYRDVHEKLHKTKIENDIKQRYRVQQEMKRSN